MDLMYDEKIEMLFFKHIVSDHTLLARCLSIVTPENFKDKNIKKLVTFLVDYVEKYTDVPSIDQLNAISIEKVELMQPEKINIDWFLKEFETFSRHRQLELAIYNSLDLLQNHKYAEVEASVKAAVQIGLVKDIGTDYFSNPEERLKAVLNDNGMISTGWKAVDAKLYGGINRGEILLFLGQSGAGKSLFLQNMAVNYASVGLNVVYISLELSERLCSMRIDAMTTGYATTDVLKNITEVSMQVAAFKKKYKGNIQIKQMPSGITPNDIRSYIKEFEIQQCLKVDVILVDYLDLLMPNGKKISASDMFVKDKYVSEELRNLGIELKTLMVSASQLNRSSYDEVEFNAANVAGGLSKVNTADNVLGIFTTAAMREAGRYQLQFLKTRSSAGVGSKVDLKFNQRTLRIEDLDEDAEPMKSTTESVLDKIKYRNAPTTLDNSNVVEKVTNVRDLLAKLNK